MLVSVNWLKDYVNTAVPVQEFCDRMILSGSNIETVQPYGTGFEKIVVAKITKIEKHPDADKLLVCQVDAGQGAPVQIVTSAKNVFEGATVPVVLSGGKIADGTEIGDTQFRGVDSYGMFCSAQEMGYEDKVIEQSVANGIWILPDELKAGTPIQEALGLEDSVVDFEITPNRPDCLSMLGMAREASAVFGTPLKYPETKAKNEQGDVKDFIDVEVKRTDLCPRYTARVIKDVKIGPSPWWMQKRLMHAGMRPINNMVDITNFVMLEYGQPLHAFDIREIEGGKIVVDTAKNDDVFTTLDGTERKLNDTILMINDAKKPIGIAGIMGGLDSEIKEDTETVVLEAANFNKDNIRFSSKALVLRTEASGRYEKGIDANLCEEAADRVCALVEQLGCGTVVGGSIDIYAEKQEAKAVKARVSRINMILDTDLSGEEMKKMLESLEMHVEFEDEDTMVVTPPTVRQDLLIEEDYVEEIARLYGYNVLPETLPGNANVARKTPIQTLREKARDILTAMGLDEVLTYSFVSPKSVDKVGITETDLARRNFVKLINPLGEENSVMRTMVTPSMMEVLATNNAKGNADARLFEIGRVFNNSPINCDGQPVEAEVLCIGLLGSDADFFVLKGMIEELLYLFGVEDVEFRQETQMPMYHPGRAADVFAGDYMLGTFGEMHPDVSERYGIEGRVYTCELVFSTIAGLSNTDILYKPLPKYPSTVRDIALIVDDEVHAGDIRDTILENGGDILEDAELFDVYRGKQIEDGKKSVAFTLTYRSADKTLTDEDVAGVHGQILEALKKEFDANLREM
ncbi:MAG: phenylalanine--tRNA ligase subunit beta [Clostridia bacterium]|nr:phenylalanine--tRNA ligase subunit beta [Clostridia bacterium]